MVKIAIAGPGQLAREIIDGLLATGKHEIVILSRQDATPENAIDGTTWVKVDYSDKQGLAQALQGVHTALSFLVFGDTSIQENLIDAAIEAGVKRFAPSEWAVSNVRHLDWYAGKVQIREYLREKNKDKKVIEYSLFQPGWFLNYLGGNHQTSKHVKTANLLLTNHEQGHARFAGDLTSRVTYTAIQDIVNIVVKAIDYEGEWPEYGGINGNTLTLAEEIAIGEKLKGKPYTVELASVEDVKAGNLDDSWLPDADWVNALPLPDDQKPGLARKLLSGVLLNLADGAAPVGDEWNRIFPDYKFTTVEEFLTGVYGKGA